MKKFTKASIGIAVFMFLTVVSHAQAVLWGGAGDPNGEFNGGLNDWTVAALSDPDALWVWNATGDALDGAYSSGSGAINSPSVSNGAAVFDSDFYDNGGMPDSFATTPPWWRARSAKAMRGTGR